MIPMRTDVPRTQDHIGKDFFAHPQAAADLLDTLMPGSAALLGLGHTYLPIHVKPVLGQELQNFGTADTRRVDLVFWIENPDRGQTVGVVHVEIQDRIQSAMPARCLTYAARLQEHLLKAEMLQDNGLPIPMQQLLVHTGRGLWTRHRPIVPHTMGLWNDSRDMPMLDIGAYRDTEWSGLSSTTETRAFICLTLLHRDVSQLLKRGQAHIPVYVSRMQRLFQQLYNLSVARGWSNRGLDDTVTRWITHSIVASVADTGHFAPRLQSARSLEDLVMDTQTLTAELNEAWDQIRAEGHAEGHAEGYAEGRRQDLLEMAAPYLSAAALDRCAAALSRRAGENLPSVNAVVQALGGPDVPQTLEILLTGTSHEPDPGPY